MPTSAGSATESATSAVAFEFGSTQQLADILDRRAIDLQGGAPQPHQAGHQEGQASICPQLLPPQGLSVELRCFPSGMPPNKTKR